MNPKQFLLILLIFLPIIHSAQIKHITDGNYDFDDDGVQDAFYKISRDYIDVYNSNFLSIRFLTENDLETAEIDNPNNEIQFLELNDTIDASLKWSKGGYVHHGYGLGINIWKEKIYFIAIRLKQASSYYYGWIRFHGGPHHGIRDAALHITPNTPILAGEGISSIKPIPGGVKKVQNNIEWSDYQVKFFAPYYDNLVKEYRVVIVKSKNTGTLQVEELLSVPATHYAKFTSGEDAYGFNLPSEMKDLDGDDIKIGEEYQLGIISLSNDTTIFAHAFNLTNSFIVNQIELSKAGKPLVLDTGDEESSRDITIKFEENKHEVFTKLYQVLVVPVDSAAGFTIEKAMLVPEENSIPVQPSGDSIYLIENTDIIDVYGNPIHQQELYKVFVYSAPDNINSGFGSLSTVSNAFSLATPGYLCANQREGEGIISVRLDERTTVLDIDQNGEPDLELTNYISDGYYKFPYRYRYWLQTADNTEISVVGEYTVEEGTFNLAENKNFWEPITEFTQWQQGKLILGYGNTAPGKERIGNFEPWSGTGVIVFRKINNNETIHGWVRVKTSYTCSFIDYYAYQNRIALTAKHNFPVTNNTLFVAYPNPNSSRILNIAIKDFNENEEYAIDILNHSGTKMKEFVIDEQQITINLKDLPRGLYYVRLRTSREQETQKIMVL